MLSFSRRGFILLGAASVLSACTSVVGPGVVTTTKPPQLTTATITAAINGVRRVNGRKPLAYSARLEAAARSQARLMARRDQLSHDLGVSLRQRVTDAGYEGAVGENVAGGRNRWNRRFRAG